MSLLTEWPLSRRQTARLLQNWNVGKLLFMRPGPGTASPAIIVTTPRGQFFLKQRSPRYSAPEWVAYDHAVMKHLARRGLPVTPAVSTPEKSRWVTRKERVFELYPWIEGDSYDPDNPQQISAAGELLARFHQATEGFSPSGRKDLPRLFDPRDRLAEIAEAQELLDQSMSTGETDPEKAREVLDYLQAQVEAILQRLPDERYWALPQVIVHADYHPANMKFGDAEIVGLFDFDWVSRQARLKDVADGLLFFAPRRCPPGADLVSLTQTPQFDVETMCRFMEPYLQRQPLTGEEGACLGDLLRERWLYVRLDAMHRKVPREKKLEFLLPGVEEPLRWLEENEERMLAALRR